MIEELPLLTQHRRARGGAWRQRIIAAGATRYFADATDDLDR
nr:hypothetical protein [Nocardia tengchongensis]